MKKKYCLANDVPKNFVFEKISYVAPYQSTTPCLNKSYQLKEFEVTQNLSFEKYFENLYLKFISDVNLCIEILKTDVKLLLKITLRIESKEQFFKVFRLNAKVFELPQNLPFGKYFKDLHLKLFGSADS